MENKPFRNLALAQKAIHEHLEMCSVEAPVSIVELYTAVKDNPNILNRDQVDTYVKRLHRNGELHRIREGLAYKYWLKTDTNKPLEKAPVTVAEFIQTAKPVNELDANLHKVSKDIPQIKITDSLITISHAKYRLSLELS